MALANVAHAAPILYMDPYGAGASNCAANACDVIGDKARFDIRSIEFTSLTHAQVTAVIRLNYNFGDASLSQYNFSGKHLEIGDLLFDTGVHKYGIPLHTHVAGTPLAAGQLYSAANFLTSSNALFNLSPFIFRTVNNAVWVDPAGAVATGSPGSVTGLNIGGPEVEVAVSFTPTNAFWHDLTSGGMEVHFASADCANDVIDGYIKAPAPGSLFLLAIGATGIAARVRRPRIRT